MANSYLVRTPGSAGNRKKFTISAWVKRSYLGSNTSTIFSSWSADSIAGHFALRFDGSDKLDLSTWSVNVLTTNRRFRDTNAWYHIVCAVDTDESTANNRVRFYVNGAEETSFATRNNPSSGQTFSVNNTNSQTVGLNNYSSTAGNMDGYMSHVAMVDGQQLTPATFGTTDSTSGIWKFKPPTGVTWGTNGFHLKFESSGNLGLDSSGQTNNFTVNGDLKQSIDTPSIAYNTLNVVANTNSNSTISDGALTHTVSGQWLGAISSFGVTSGKWYAEAKITDEQNFNIGFATLVGNFINNMNTANSGYVGQGDDSWGFWGNGAGNAQKVHNNSASNYGSAFSTNDIMILAMDVDNKKLYFGKNGTFFDSSNPATQANPAYTFTTTNPMGFASGPENGAVQWNFGAGNFGDTPITSAGSNGNGSLFEYDVPSGFYALNTKNINTYG